jgi:hypothetical protein
VAEASVDLITMKSPGTEAKAGQSGDSNPEIRAEAAWIGGFVAAEGTFTQPLAGRKFSFGVALGALDSESCERLRAFFGVGSIVRSKRRRDHYDDEVQFQVRSLKDLVHIVMPFMDAHLPPSHKRQQYLRWKQELLHYWDNGAKRVRACTVPDCETQRRAHGLCRHHLYRAGLG